MEEINLKYPIGKFKAPYRVTTQDRERYIMDLEKLPGKLRTGVESLTEAQLDVPYRKHGWTVRQVVHHLSDSHLNSYIRFKLSLTENQPIIKSYDEKAWAELPDSQQGPVEFSLDLLESIHRRWVYLLRNMKESDWKKSFRHPETNKVIPLDLNLSLYSWHGKHHLAHIESLISRQGWQLT
ncbi:MAG: putative metal-dependent hydrolase YfiT [Cyclobacteriaceae bacterium]|nr:MAG: putative metal-dependent hydrolase YfiT [Cyclobacteriaceae bacterium]